MSDTQVVIINDSNKLRDFYELNKKSVFVGFNNKHYDNHIFKGILKGMDPFKISQDIIVEKKQGWQVVSGWDYQFASFDLMKSIRGFFGGLKEIEANMGWSIEESEIDFKMDRKLNQQELDSTEKYCKFDVKATKRIALLNKAALESQLKIVVDYGLPMRFLIKTHAQLTAELLGAIRKRHGDDNEYTLAKEININKYPQTVEYFTSGDVPKRPLIIEVAGTKCVFGRGGIHSAVHNYIGTEKNNLMLIDVTSYYPNLMINYNYLPRTIAGENNSFEKITKLREAHKKAGRKAEADALKLVIVTTYGAMDEPYNDLYDPKMRLQVAVTGQLLLLDLIEKLEPHMTLVQSNTDGIIIEAHNEPVIRKVVKEWEIRTGLNMEYTKAKKLFQKDVNNYILVEQDGSVKVKGSYVTQYNNYKKPSQFIKCNGAIIDKAVVEYFVNDTPVETTIKNETDIIQFQFVAKHTYKYQGMYQDQVLNGRIKKIKLQKVNRYFPTLNKNFGKLYKSKGEDVYHKVTNTPDYTKVINWDIQGSPSNWKEKIELDEQFYIDAANKRILAFNKKRK